MSTFTQWNGPGGFDRIPIKEWVELREAYAQLVNELHKHISEVVGPKFTVKDDGSIELDTTSSQYVHSFDSPLRSLIKAFNDLNTFVTTSLSGKQDNLNITGTATETEDVKKNVYSKGQVDALLSKKADTTALTTVDASVSADSVNPVQSKAIKVELDKKLDKAAITTTLPSADDASAATKVLSASAVASALKDYTKESKVGELPATESTVVGYIKKVENELSKYLKIVDTGSADGKVVTLEGSTDTIATSISGLVSKVKALSQKVDKAFNDDGSLSADIDLSNGVSTGQISAAEGADSIQVQSSLSANAGIKTDTIEGTSTVSEIAVKNKTKIQNDLTVGGKTSLQSVTVASLTSSGEISATSLKTAGSFEAPKIGTEVITLPSGSTKTEIDIRATTNVNELHVQNTLLLGGKAVATTDMLSSGLNEVNAKIDANKAEAERLIALQGVPVGEVMRWGIAEKEERTVHSDSPFEFEVDGTKYTVEVPDEVVTIYVSKSVPEGWHALDGSIELDSADYPELAAVMSENVTNDGKIWLPYKPQSIIKIIA